MKRFWPTLLFVVLVVFVCAETASAQRGGGGGGRGGGGGWSGHSGGRAGGWSGHSGARAGGWSGHSGGHRFNGGHGHWGRGHGHTHFAFGFFAGPWYGAGWPWYEPYYYPAYRYPAAPYYYDGPAAYISQDTYAAQPAQAPSAPAAWYYCAPLKGFYPYVGTCPEPWDRVDPIPPPGSDNSPRTE
jgi:hypothetical protein